MDKTNQSIEQIFTDPKNHDHFLKYVLYELLTQGDNTRFIQILTEIITRKLPHLCV